MSDDPDLEELREQTTRSDRLDEEAEEQSRTFVDELVDAMDDVEDGDASETLSIYDRELAAIVLTLQRNPNRLGDDISAESRSDIIRTALTLGMRELDDGNLADSVQEARRERATDDSAFSL